MRYDVVIVGAGHSGAQAAIALRQQKFAGTIAIVGDEPDPPYERPPLSKEYLAGEKPFERLLIRPLSFWVQRGITMLTGHQVISVDASAHTVTVTNGNILSYGKLIWATGGKPRRLGCQGHDLAGVHTVRARADVDCLVSELPTTQRVCVVGGGFIGLEAAAVLAKLGRQVTVIETQQRLLARVAGRALSNFLEAKHRSNGVDFRLRAHVDCIEEADGRACGVRLANGEVISCDMVIVGIGIVPLVEPLLAAGAAGEDGVAVDRHGSTSLPDIYAVGDCAAQANSFAGGSMIRTESVQNAGDTAVAVARHIVGLAPLAEPVPWFWSNQYDVRLQTVGLTIGHDAEVVRGDPATGKFSVIYLKQGVVVALDCVNATKDYVQGKSLVALRVAATAASLADTSRSLEFATAASMRH